MKVLYFGDPQGALELIARGVSLCGVVHGRKGGVGWIKLIQAIKSTTPTLPRWIRPDLSNAEVIDELRSLAPDLIVSGFYPRLIPAELLSLAPGYNVHPSDLPKWRGPDPAYWVVRNGETQTAICVHRLTKFLDEGEIAHREVISVRAWESGGALASRLERRAAEVLGEFIAQVIQGEEVHLTPQTGVSSWAPLVSPDDLEIDWSWSAQEIGCLVRAASPDPGAFTGIGSELIVVYRGAVIKDPRLLSIPVGSPVLLDGKCIIRCGEDAYRLDRIKLGRKMMSGRDFAQLLA